MSLLAAGVLVVVAACMGVILGWMLCESEHVVQRRRREITDATATRLQIEFETLLNKALSGDNTAANRLGEPPWRAMIKDRYK